MITRHRDAPSATAASTCSRLASTRTIARTPRATRGQPSRTKMPVSEATTTPRGSTSGSAARSATTAYNIGSTSRTSPLFSTAASTRPPAIPAQAPSTAPTARVPRVARRANPSDDRTPNRVCESTSLPSASAPSRNTGASAARDHGSGTRPSGIGSYSTSKRSTSRTGTAWRPPPSMRTGMGGANGYPAKRCAAPYGASAGATAKAATKTPRSHKGARVIVTTPAARAGQSSHARCPRRGWRPPGRPPRPHRSRRPARRRVRAGRRRAVVRAPARP